jgi:hypothetical protein
VPPERTDRERIGELEHDVETLSSDLKSVEGDQKAAMEANRLLIKDVDEMKRVVLDEKEGLRPRVRSLEETRQENEKLKSYISGQIRTWVLIGTGILATVEIIAKFWPHK